MDVILQQDEERLAELFSFLTGGSIGVKWGPIWTMTGSYRPKEQQEEEERVYAIHLECALDKAREARNKLSTWYGSNSSIFPDGTKMRLAPPFSTILSISNRSKYTTLIAQQAALSAKLGIDTTWELSSNLILDKSHPDSGVSLRQLLMSIPSQVFPWWPLFHILDRQWKSEKGISFGFTPKNESDACTIIAGLIPYLRDTADAWYMSSFSANAIQRHSLSKWDPSTRQVYSAEELAITAFLADDDELNQTDIPMEEKFSSPPENTHVVPSHSDTTTYLYQDDNSVSTLATSPHPSSIRTPDISRFFHPQPSSGTPSLHRSSGSESSCMPTSIHHSNNGLMSKMSDTKSRIADIEYNVSMLSSEVYRTLQQMKQLWGTLSEEGHSTQITCNHILQLLQSKKILDGTCAHSSLAKPPTEWWHWRLRGCWPGCLAFRASPGMGAHHRPPGTQGLRKLSHILTYMGITYPKNLQILSEQASRISGDSQLTKPN